MNLQELDQFNLQDAVKFHDRLNPRLWGRDEHLLPEVSEKLLAAAAEFQEFLGVPDLDVVDITVSGSNAAYSYTPRSDIDLHLVVNMPEQNREIFQELFNAKKYEFNDQHDIKIRDVDVEFYAQPSDEDPKSQGIYSLKHRKWLQIPRRRRAEIDDSCVKAKAEDLDARIHSAIASGDVGRMQALWQKIKAMRQSGLESNGEFGCENLAFKILRAGGCLKELKQALNQARDRELSLAERQKPRTKFRYGFGEGHQGSSYSSEDGVAPSTQMFLNETDQDEQLVHDFIKHTAEQLGIERMPEIHLHRDDDWGVENHSFGRYEPDTHTLEVNLAGRHIMDILRTTAHELAHCRQHELSGLPDNAGDTGSPWENEAHAVAGVIMRNWADRHPELFDSDVIEESASGYIPTKKQARDPRYSMALTVDIKPGQVGKEANKMKLKTDSQGRPALLMKTANMIGESQIKDLNEPRGPEFKPTMPAGTVKVDVSDVYDWYKLGQHISNLKGLGHHDFGQGPPSTIISFGDEDTEHKYIKDLEKTGLTTTDIDPVDPKQPPGMPRQKTDPTYNVDEEEDIIESLGREFELLENEFISEIRMSTANLRQEAAKTGAMAGMEFEMIVPNVQAGEMDPEYERDESYDRRARSFDDIEEFFNDGDYNGRGDIRRLMESLKEDFENWKMERIGDDWSDEGIDFLRDYIANNDLFDRDRALDQARDEIIDANPDLPQDSEDFQQLVNARINELEEEYVREEWEDGINGRSHVYDNAFEEFVSEKSEDIEEQDWLQENTPYMSDVESSYDISWPYYYDINAGQGGDMNIDEVANDFSEFLNKPVNASASYHGARREPGHYVVEPDGSLEADSPEDGGLEFVSPPMPIDELLADLIAVKEWAGNNGCYTNDSTGLHINISVPNYSLDKLDYVKLALLMGDEYVLELFGRTGNHYAKAATGKIRDMLRNNPDLAPQIMDKMRGHMEDLATKAIHSGRTDKYTSINTKEGYIEFRSPGGDWLDENFDKIENTLLRFTVALSAAINPQAYRKEYLKKLYKLLEGSQEKGGVDVINLFANYSAGELDKAALIRQVREKQLARGVAKGKVTGPMWWSVTNPANNAASIEVVANNAEEAIASAILPGNYPEWARVRNTLRATPVRPYTAPTAKATQPAAPDTGNWGIWINTSQRFAREPGEHPAGQEIPLRRFPTQQAAEQFLAQTREQNPRMRTDVEVREIPADYVVPPPQGRAYNPAQAQQQSGRYTYRVYTDSGQTAGTFQSDGIQGSTAANIAFRNYLSSIGRDSASGFNYEEIGRERVAPQPAAAGGNFTGNWLIQDPDGRTIYRFGGIGNNQGDANNFAIRWLSQNPRHMQAGVTVVPEMG